MICVALSGLKEKTRHFLLLHLDGDSSFGDLGNLLAIFFSMHAEQESSLNMIAAAASKEELGEDNRTDFKENSLQQEQEQDKRKLGKGGKGKSTKEKGGAYKPQPPAYRGKGEPNQLPNSAQRACRDKPEETKGKCQESNPNLTKGKGQESHPSFKRELERRGKSGRQKQRKGKGEAYSPQPPAYLGKGKQKQLPTQELWCTICQKKGHRTQACWWNNNQQEQKHQKKNAWRNPRRKKQLQSDNGDQSFADWLASNKSLMSSFEQQSQDKSLAMLENLDNSLAAPTWALLVDTGAATSVAPQSFAPHLELSPAPSTFQLATATGEAIKIFGLRHVHLQCQDLSFKVSFVIADIVTPFLGMDMFFQHNLSLTFEHGQGLLVNQTGKRTQLQQKGEHLYLVACPFQHGLSTSFCGSLSDVIGFSA